MAVYIGPPHKCGPAVADHIGLREGEQVAHLTADTSVELRTFADQIGVPRKQLMGGHGLRWRYIITLGERMIARARGAREVTLADLGRMESLRGGVAARG